MKTILFLEGMKGTDFRDDFDSLNNKGYEVSILDNLYTEPEKMEQIKVIDPDCLFIATTGIRKKELYILSSYFYSLNYIPRNVMFDSERTVRLFLEYTRELKKLGTKFYFLPNPYNEEKIETEINWI